MHHTLAALDICTARVPRAALLGRAAQSAHAQDDDDPDAVAQAKEHYRAGLDAYKAGHYDVAIRELKKAYLLKKLPPLLLNIGATYRKMGDLDLALHFYQKFLDEAPADAKDRPEVEHIIAEIKTQKSAAVSDMSRRLRARTTTTPPRSRVVAAVSGTTPSSTLRHPRRPSTCASRRR